MPGQRLDWRDHPTHLQVVMATAERGANGEITIQGSPQADTITAFTRQDDPDTIKVVVTVQTGTKSTAYEFDAAEVQRLILRGGEGNDTIIVKDDIASSFCWEKSTAVDGSFQSTLTRQVAFASELYGEAGNDQLVAGAATTLISGGSGRDRFDLSSVEYRQYAEMLTEDGIILDV